MGKDQSGAIGLLDDLGHGEGLAGAGYAEQHLVAFARSEALHQLGDCTWLIAPRLVGGHQLKVHG